MSEPWKLLTDLGDARTWRNFALLLCPLAAVTALYASTSRSIFELWTYSSNYTYGHGWLVFAVSLWLLHQCAGRLPHLEMRPSLRGAGVLLIVGIGWLLAKQMNIELVQQGLLPLIILSAQWSLFGFSIARLCFIAVSYAYFALPIWDLLNPLLQWGTVVVQRGLVRIVGMPAYFEGNAVHLPSGIFVVEGTCSGLRFVVVGLALATLFGYLRRTKNRFGLLVLALGLAMLANWLRVFVIIVAGYLTQMQHYLVRVEHMRFGWVCFAVMMWAFFFVAARMAESPDTPIKERPSQIPSILGRRDAQLMAALVALVAVPAWSNVIVGRMPAPIVSVYVPKLSSDWLTGSAADTAWQPIFANADAQIRARFSRDGRSVEFFHCVFADQSQEKKFAGYGNTPIGTLPPGSVILRSDEVPRSATGDAVGRFMETELVSAQGRHTLIWHGYYVDNKWFTQPLLAQTWYGVKSVATGSISGVMAFRADCDDKCDTARAMLTELALALRSDAQ